MSETIITVTASADTHHSPERATVQLALGFEGPERQPVFERTRQLHAETSESLRALHDPIADAVTRWSADQVSVWGQRPWSQDGAQLPPVYHATTTVRARFRDFSALATWIDSVAFRDGVTVTSVEWTLTSATHSALQAEAQKTAIVSARSKAQSYAEALGLSNLRPIAVADPGMLGDVGGAGSTMSVARFASHDLAKSGAGEPLDLTPADVVISASIEARFAATA
ncbi:hypothetical protein SAMN06295879_0994 [Agreia bicolorata]|uniref:SIMPL domain-containing protein n=1 Tax=Agreia bicolorata TaxID=110935 RepID=A0A1T4XCI1_9MICO|nr:SIMPL domain-containing protein [Agreia bicolorata]SKA86875.1 hypothetical protein SAMN06295879_0994 [Agreia bicolorata]